MNEQKTYGFFGWKEFARNRKLILCEFDLSKEVNASRPVQTEHGNAVEAKIRSWLSEFLPFKYGVTSGYIIPDIITEESYTLYHYDIIIYDKINSPTLWTDSNNDHSEQAKKRAIPAKYVYSVIEVKSSFNSTTIKDSLDKLSQLNHLSEYLPPIFSSSVIFIELKKEQLNNSKILLNFCDKPPYKFWGGMIMRSDLNTDMTGLISLYEDNENRNSVEFEFPLAKNIDELDIQVNREDGSITGAQYTSIRLYKGEGDIWHPQKGYCIPVFHKGTVVALDWSYNEFSKFTVSLLAYLEGRKQLEKHGMVYGQVFDILRY